MKPRNLAQLKKFLKPGDVLTVTFHQFLGTNKQGSTPTPMVIDEINSVAVILKDHNALRPFRMWSRYQKADRYTFTDDGYSIKDEDGKVYASYAYA